MRIAIDIRSLQGGQKTGVGEYTAELVQAVFLLDANHEYILFSNGFFSKKHINNFGFPKKHIQYVHTRYPNKLFTLLTSFGLILLDEIVEKKTGKSIDVFFSPSVQTGFVSKKTPWILTIHDLSYEVYSECLTLKRKIWHRLAQPKKQAEQAVRVITPSKSAARDVIAQYQIDPSRVQAIYPGLKKLKMANLREVKSWYSLPKNYILCLGTIEPRKNLEQLLKAYQQTDLHIQGVKLLIAGAGGWKNRRIYKQIKKTPGAQYIGYIHAEHKGRLMQQANAFIYPSVYEGFGFPVLEALSVGTPVICGNRSSLPEVVQKQAILVDPDNSYEFARAMIRSIYYPDSGRLSLEQYQWKKTAKEFITVCTTIFNQ